MGKETKDRLVEDMIELAQEYEKSHKECAEIHRRIDELKKKYGVMHDKLTKLRERERIMYEEAYRAGVPAHEIEVARRLIVGI